MVEQVMTWQDSDDERAPHWGRSHWWGLAAILCLALFLRGWNLGFPTLKYFDEIYYVDAAQDYLAGRPDSNNVHPPLAKLQIALALVFFGGSKAMGWHQLDETIGWRLAPLLAGMGTVALTAALGYCLSGRPRVGLLAAGLVAIEHLSVVESRITTLDSIQTFWITLGLYACAHRLWRSSHDGWLLLSAASLGVATACKWNGLFAVGAALLAFWTIPTSRPRPSALKVLLSYAWVVPTIYAASYYPFALTRAQESLGQIGQAIYDQHHRMVEFRYNPEQFKHQYLSQFWCWPWAYKPVWFHFQTLPQGMCSGIVAFGCLPFWWFSLYVLLELLAASWRSDSLDPAGQWLVICYGAQWLLWGSSTTGGFFYYMLTVVPLMAVAAARVLDRVLLGSGRRWAQGFLVLLSLLTLAYFPFMTGMKVPYSYFSQLFFVSGWVK